MSQPAESSTNRTLIIVLAIAAGVILLGFCGCVGVGLLGYLWTSQTAMQAREEAEVARAVADEHRQAAQQAAAEAERRQAGALNERHSAELREQAQQVSRQFLDLLQAQRTEEAYRLTTTVFQSRYDRAGFQKFVEQHPELKQQPVSLVTTPSDAAGEIVIRLRFTSPMRRSEPMEVELRLTCEEDRWRINEIRAGKDRVPGPQGNP